MVGRPYSCGHCAKQIETGVACPACDAVVCANSGLKYVRCVGYNKVTHQAAHPCSHEGKDSGTPCPSCGTQLVWKTARYSVFRACPNFPKCLGKVGSPRGRRRGPRGEPTEPGQPEPGQSEPVVPGETESTNESEMEGEGESETQPETESGKPDSETEPMGEVAEAEAKMEAKVEIEMMMRPPEGEPPKPESKSLWDLVRPAALQEVPTREQVTAALTSMAARMPTGLSQSEKATLRAAARDAETARAELGPLGTRVADLEARTPRIIEVRTNGEKTGEIGGFAHPALEEGLAAIAAGFENLLFVGPAGSGKTTLCAQIAKALGRPFVIEGITAGMPESRLIGRNVPNLQTGRDEYSVTAVIQTYEGGGVICLDEADRGDANTMCVVNAGLANGHWPIPRLAAPIATRHKDTVIVCTANTFGNGASRQYVGANQLDAAWLDRFAGAVIRVEYDRGLETSLVPEQEVRERVWALRDAVEKNAFRRIVGTRSLLAAARWVRAGRPLSFAVGKITEDWTADERAACEVSA